jgi:hypothetical protein
MMMHDRYPDSGITHWWRASPGGSCAVLSQRKRASAFGTITTANHNWLLPSASVSLLSELSIKTALTCRHRTVRVLTFVAYARWHLLPGGGEKEAMRAHDHIDHAYNSSSYQVTVLVRLRHGTDPGRCEFEFV